MPRFGVRLGGLSVSCHANGGGLGLGVSLRGRWWDALVNRVRRRRALQRHSVPTAQGIYGIAQPLAMPVGSSSLTPENGLTARVASTEWYHTIDLGHGVRTPGRFDHGPILDRYRLPDSLAGSRVLDVATFDGFWAFEFEKRGAKEVIALDLERPTEIDFPPKILATATPADAQKRFGRGFAIAKEALQSRATRVACNVYDLSPERLGRFDVVHAGDVLLHLNSPVRALQNISSVCDGYALISDVYFPDLDLHGAGPVIEYLGGELDVVWWKFSLSALERMILDAGFERVELLAKFRYGLRGEAENMHHAVFKAYK